jgi:malate dehydrogenase (oxaloacetate-decarboxylating)(NADP+)
VRGVIDEGMAWPMLVGQTEAIIRTIDRLGLRMDVGLNFELIDPEHNPYFNEMWIYYHKLMERRGVTENEAQTHVRRNTTLVGALLLALGYGDGLICGTEGVHRAHLAHIEAAVGRRPGVNNFYTVNVLSTPGRTLFLTDTNVNYDPTPDQIVEMTVLAAEEMQRFGVEPRAALLSHSSFGSADTPTAVKMRTALRLLQERHSELEVEGEMHGDSALDTWLRRRIFPGSRLTEDANLLVFPTLDAANIAFNLLKTVSGGGVTVGPILLGAAKPVHVLTSSATVRRIINMTALTVVEAGCLEK